MAASTAAIGAHPRHLGGEASNLGDRNGQGEWTEDNGQREWTEGDGRLP